MRKKLYVTGALGVLAIAVAIPATAMSTVTSQTITSTVTPTKLSKSKKTPTPASIAVAVDAGWSSFGPPPNPTPAPVETDVDFDSDMIFNTKPVKTCAPSALSGTTTEQAKAACSASVVGGGTARLNGIIGNLTGVVTAFNGTPVGGKSVILLHARVSNPPLTQVLVGTLDKSPLGKPYGSRLSVPIPAAQLGGGLEVITHFDTTVNKKFKITKKVKGKKTKVKSGYVTATCADKKLQTQGTFKFGTAPAFSPSSTIVAQAADQACKQVKPKK